MTDIVRYAKSKERLEKREDFLCKLIDDLDKESEALFDEIVNLSDISYYKISNLTNRVNNIERLFKETEVAFAYIDDIEKYSYIFADMRRRLKGLLTAITSIYAFFLVSPPFGILSYSLLSITNMDYFYRELDDINNRIDRLNAPRLNRINSIIGNCDRILNGKVNKMNEDGNLHKVINDTSLLVTRVNNYIFMYIDGMINYSDIETISEEEKELLIDILKQDLNTDIDDLYELLELAKKQRENGLKLTKEYK